MDHAQQSLRPRIDLTNVLFFCLTPLAAVGLGIVYIQRHHFVGWPEILTLFVTFLATAMSITGGYHRLFTHRSYEVKPWLKALFLIVGAGAFEGSALQWGADHRRHHRFVDTDRDPHNIRRGFFYAHMGWLFLKEEPAGGEADYPRDLASDPMIRWQDRYYVPLAVFVGFIFPLLVGGLFGNWLGGLLFGGVLRIVLSNHITFLINSLAHTWGRRPYNDKQTARDSLLMAFLACGEGYHNYHHQFQSDYRNGNRWYHWDPTKWMIQLFSLFGWAYRLKAISSAEILRVRLRNESNRLLSKGVGPEKITNLRTRVEEAQGRFRQLCADYQRLKENVKEYSTNRRLELKAELKMARLELKSAWRQWGIFRRTLQALPAS